MTERREVLRSDSDPTSYQLRLFELEDRAGEAAHAQPGYEQANRAADESVTATLDRGPLHPEEPSIERSSQDASARFEVVRGACLQCGACSLVKTRTQVVFGDGNPRSPMAIVGEGPGEQEDATGKPFVGRSGALLEQALRENQMLRKHVYITNVLKCRACARDGDRLRNRPPEPIEVDACRPWLVAELEIVSPLVILCLGGPAASWIIHPDFRITRERGQWFPSRWAPAAIASFHPSYVLRQQGKAFNNARDLLVQDIASARQKVIELRRSAATPSSQLR